ncbi:hypothetical protein Q8A67_004400 [Cirrhinus molitorella]|uniref:Endonuclease domain-containing 1 protein n=1 Tax=Cirrhinus molitorella TaxID=172907 RepID=A0AA88QAQ8_9TELE|nr:hypothetical protein Q8A67_004400 [Cirrhinus molitorella]
MEFEKDVKGLGNNQSLSEDYEKSGYDRGHLAPVYQAQSQNCANATFTLTNAAPQDPSFNRENLIIHHLFNMMLVLHVLMLWLLSNGSGKVVLDFESECGQYFANRKSPTQLPGSQYKQICQTLNNVDYYATFYDTKNKIPVYSSYKFEGLKDCTRQNKWYIEPQLDDNNASSNMEFENDVKIPGLGIHQALNRDYNIPKYDRGHLVPVYQAQSQSCADATFTLTNAAPQDLSFNRGQWRLDDNNGSPSMIFETDVKKQGLGNYQALNSDYKKSERDRGHLEPVYQAQSQGCADATFTLTNAAPQDPSFNRGESNVLWLPC